MKRTTATCARQVMSNESSGISDEAVVASAIRISIPMLGSIATVNRGISTPCVVHEIAKQHRAFRPEHRRALENKAFAARTAGD